MSSARSKTGLTVLQWALGVVILIEAVLFVLPSAAHDFARTHMPGFVRMVLGFGGIRSSTQPPISPNPRTIRTKPGM